MINITTYNNAQILISQSKGWVLSIQQNIVGNIPSYCINGELVSCGC